MNYVVPGHIRASSYSSMPDAITNCRCELNGREYFIHTLCRKITHSLNQIRCWRLRQTKMVCGGRRVPFIYSDPGMVMPTFSTTNSSSAGRSKTLDAVTTTSFSGLSCSSVSVLSMTATTSSPLTTRPNTT